MADETTFSMASPELVQLVVDGIAQHAEVRLARDARAARRGHCPLCGQLQPLPEARQISFPQWLRVHLVGVGNAHPCTVIRAVVALAQQHWDRQFHGTQNGMRVDPGERMARRYAVDPGLELELVDGGGLALAEVRTAVELHWAERRLLTLDFRMRVEDRVRSYTRAYKPFVVYADPRRKGRIDFTIHPHLLPRYNRTPAGQSRAINQFSLLDVWQHNLHEKYQRSLADTALRLPKLQEAVDGTQPC